MSQYHSSATVRSEKENIGDNEILSLLAEEPLIKSSEVIVAGIIHVTLDNINKATFSDLQNKLKKRGLKLVQKTQFAPNR